MRYSLYSLFAATAFIGVSLALLLNASQLTGIVLHSSTCLAMLISTGCIAYGTSNLRRRALAYLGGTGVFLLYYNFILFDEDYHQLVTTVALDRLWQLVHTETPSGWPNGGPPISNPAWSEFYSTGNLLIANFAGVMVVLCGEAWAVKAPSDVTGKSEVVGR